MEAPSDTHTEGHLAAVASTPDIKEAARFHPEDTPFDHCTSPIEFAFQNVSYDVQFLDGKETKTKTVLDSVSGIVKPGHILAIMGPSGAGKTSLLQILSLRTRSGGVSGRILANGWEIDSRSVLSRFASFVSQDDVVAPTLTVRETFRFYAGLKMPAGTTDEQREERVSEVIRLLQLEKAADTLVGDELIRGISGGEKRRVTIGVELLINPSCVASSFSYPLAFSVCFLSTGKSFVGRMCLFFFACAPTSTCTALIFMDEPTSGLDSSTAVAIMELLQSLAMSGRTVVCTIHQPRSSVFWMFDQVMLLSQGKTIFLGGTQASIDFMRENGYPVPEFENPADHALDTLTMFDQENGDEKIQELHEAFVKSQAGERLESKIQESAANSTEDVNEKFPKQQKASWGSQLKWILWREYKTMVRDKFTFWGRIIQAVVNGLLIGLVFLQLDKTQASITSRYGMLLFLIVGTGFVSVITQVQIMPSKRLIFDRERSSNSYSVSSFYWGLTLSDIPAQLIIPVLTTLMVYWTVGLQDQADKFFIFLGVLLATFQAAYAIGFLIGSMVPTVEVGLAIGPVIMVMNMLFAGFFVNLEDIPVFLRWITYVSFARYGFQALSINEYEGLTLTCTSEELAQSPSGNCPITTGQQALTAYSMDEFSIWVSVVVLVSLALAFRFLTMLALVRHDKKRQG